MQAGGMATLFCSTLRELTLQLHLSFIVCGSWFFQQRQTDAKAERYSKSATKRPVLPPLAFVLAHLRLF